MTACLADVGPIDAFKANYSATHVSATFNYRSGLANSKDFVAGFAGFRRPPSELSEYRPITGRWSCDGEAEHAIRTATAQEEEAYRRILAKSPDGMLFEQLNAGNFHVWRTAGSDTDFQVRVTPALGCTHMGPYQWWGRIPFPAILEEHFAGIAPTRSDVEVEGSPCEAEVYTKNLKTGWYRIEVVFDPSVAYLPRFFRGIEYIAADKKAWVQEMTLRESKPCAAGGFVPTDWQTLFYAVDTLGPGMPGPEVGNTLPISGENLSAGRFRIDSIEDRSGPVRTEDRGRIGGLISSVGLVGFKEVRKVLTARDVATHLTALRTTPTHGVVPNIDLAERDRFAAKPIAPSSPWRMATIVSAALLIIAAGFFVRSKTRVARLVAPALLLAACVGCKTEAGPSGASGPPVLAAKFETPTILYSPTDGGLPLTLEIANRGNGPTTILKGDGGCTCRQVDASVFPATLHPGDVLKVPVVLNDRRQFEPQQLTFSVETDRGTAQLPAMLHALPRDYIDPGELSFEIPEDEPISVEIVHRRIRKPGDPISTAEIKAPSRFVVSKTANRTGAVSGAPDYTYEDTTYRVVINDRSFGLNKDTIAFVEPGGGKLAEVPVAWRRVPFLSSAPDRLNLGSKPIRAFLRCLDDKVELVKVLSAPQGVEAVVSSTREVTVRLGESPPAVIDGTIEVATTAKDKPPLRIPVVRYAPKGPRVGISEASAR